MEPVGDERLFYQEKWLFRLVMNTLQSILHRKWGVPLDDGTEQWIADFNVYATTA